MLPFGFSLSPSVFMRSSEVAQHRCVPATAESGLCDKLRKEHGISLAGGRFSGSVPELCRIQGTPVRGQGHQLRLVPGTLSLGQDGLLQPVSPTSRADGICHTHSPFGPSLHEGVPVQGGCLWARSGVSGDHYTRVYQWTLSCPRRWSRMPV